MSHNQASAAKNFTGMEVSTQFYTNVSPNKFRVADPLFQPSLVTSSQSGFKNSLASPRVGNNHHGNSLFQSSLDISQPSIGGSNQLLANLSIPPFDLLMRHNQLAPQTLAPIHQTLSYSMHQHEHKSKQESIGSCSYRESAQGSKVGDIDFD